MSETTAAAPAESKAKNTRTASTRPTAPSATSRRSRRTIRRLPLTAAVGASSTRSPVIRTTSEATAPIERSVTDSSPSDGSTRSM